MNPEARRKRIDELREKIVPLKDELEGLVFGCSHETVVEVNNSAECYICGDDLGLWCPASSDHLCSYSQNGEICDYCGGFRERQ
ncbi:hypothetical protein CMI37_18405 [Candidatus Pacearchaeota archaeon]|nr:hypothetical protein [Candidatus Pacearchaeota archaeon]|tara:strand:+ start:139 stop:390 length:252 start_codon:yes stop_codon:yes gene_type:complete